MPIADTLQAMRSVRLHAVLLDRGCRFGPRLIIWFIAVVIGFAVGILVALPVFIILVPAFIAFMAGGNNPSFTPLVIAGLCIVAYIPVSLVANGILTAYLESVWTLTYLRLTKLKPDSQVAIAPQNA